MLASLDAPRGGGAAGRMACAAGGSTGEIYAFNQIPEPASLSILGLLGGMTLLRRRRRD